MRPLAMFRAALLVAAAGTACDRSMPTNPKLRATFDAQAASTPDGKNFVAHLTGSNEVPGHDTRAVGQVKFQLSADGTALEYRLISADIDNVIASHIHIAAAGVNGPVVVFLFGTVPSGGGRFDGVLAEGTVSAANFVGPLAGQPFSALVDAIRAGNAYVNVHTNDGVAPPNTGPGDFPGGEIRGQIRTAGPTP